MHSPLRTPHSALPKGFTLVEMLVSMAIFAVITGMVIANLRVGSQGDELRISSQLVASALRRVQTMASTGQTVRVCVGGTEAGSLCPSGLDADCSGGGASCGRDTPPAYGMRFTTIGNDARVMITFADMDNDRVFDAQEEVRRDNISSGPFVVVSDVSPSAAGFLDIAFVPPRPSTVVNGATTAATAEITVRHSQTNNAKIVTINRVSGQVSAE